MLRALRLSTLVLCGFVVFLLLVYTVLDGTYSAGYVGLHSGLFKFERTWLGIPIKREVTQTNLSRALTEYLGPQPAETEWCITSGYSTPLFGRGGFVDGIGGTYGVAYDELAALLTHMSDDAVRKCLCEFLRATYQPIGDYLPQFYIRRVSEAVTSLSHQAQASDIPTFEAVYQRWLEMNHRPSNPGLPKQAGPAGS